MLDTMRPPKPDIDTMPFGPNQRLKLFAFLLREKDSVPLNTMEHLELTYGENEDSVIRGLMQRYGGDLDDMEIKLVGALPADSLVMPIVEDLYYEEWNRRQEELRAIEKKLPAARKKAFIQHLKTSNDTWGKSLGKKDRAELTRIIGKLEKVA